MLRVIAIRLAPRASRHSGIACLKTEAHDGQQKEWRRHELVAAIRGGERVVVLDVDRRADLVVSVLDGSPPYLRAFYRAVASDALLQLPRF